MAYIIFCLVVIFLAIIGFIEVLRHLVARIYKYNSLNTITLIFPDCHLSESTEYNLRSYAERVRWGKNQRSCKTICIFDKLKPEVEHICKLVCSEYEFMEMMSTNEFIDEIKNINRNCC